MYQQTLTASEPLAQNARPRVALVTGASRGIGAATARRLAADGLTLAINSYPDERMVEAATGVMSDIQSNGAWLRSSRRM
ncbi:SDR family NAD(P)-dependent oxidoreductase [Phytoactinopolyspora mesophila]|uniref:SDR family NAD(P)-dependent oxidoreductase n=1 Tax=Phytoactinopolyspora mesophila TaxID=2650750 RepID=A0A7K3M076_9ACTN|nr:SDR family NAD(P)-dependent oxidoreductase [Phytoactinopolyspora mesophila]